MAHWLGRPAVDSYKGLSLADLPLNHAYLIANTSFPGVGVYSLTDNCFNCPYQLAKDLEVGKEAIWQVDTSILQTWKVMKTGQEFYETKHRRGLLCQMRPRLSEYGVYRLDVGKCQVTAEVAPVNTYLPLILCMSVLFGLWALYALIKFMIYYVKKRRNDKQVGLVINTNTTKWKEYESLLSLEMIRGFLIAIIIFTVSGGGGYPLFKNSWGGLSMADYLFYIYAWTVGVKIPTTVDQALARGQSKCSIAGDIFKRSFYLFLLGTMIETTDMKTSRFDELPSLWCPLIRIAISYYVVATAYVLTSQKIEMKSKHFVCKVIANFVSLMWCWIFSFFLLALLTISISAFVSFNCQANALLDDPMPDLSNVTSMRDSCNNNFTSFINNILVADPRMVVYVNSFYLYGGGVMGTMSTILISMIGLKTGTVYLHHESHSDRLKLWSIWAVIFTIGSVIFAGTSSYLKFNMWPITTVLLISTTAVFYFFFIYSLTEVWGLTNFLITSIGTTSLVLFAGHRLFLNSLPFYWNIRLDNHLIFLLQDFWVVLLWIMIGYVMKKSNVKFYI